MNKVTKILLFSGGSDSVLISHLYKPDFLVYIDMGTAYADAELEKIKSGIFKDDPRLRIIDFKVLGRYERQSDAILPLRNMYLPMIVCNEFPVEEYGDLDICLGATASDRILDKDPTFVEKFNDVINYLYLPQHWIPQGRKVRLNVDYKKYTKTEMLKLFKDQGGDIEELEKQSFSCYDPVKVGERLEECWCRNGICKSCFRKYTAYKLNGMDFNHINSNIDTWVCEAIKAEILPQIQSGIYNRGKEEEEIKQVLKIYQEEYPQNIDRNLYNPTNHRKQ